MKMPDAAERKVLIITTFVSACIAFAPQEWTSAITLLLASGAMALYDRRLVKREKAREEAASAAAITASAEPMTPPTEVAPPAAEAASMCADSAPRAEPAAPPPAA
jgi:hypothetical protein